MKTVNLTLLLFAVCAMAHAASISVDCPSVQVATPPSSGNANATPCTLATPSGTVTLLELIYKYSITTDLTGGSASFDHSTNNAALSFFNNGAAVLLVDPPGPLTTGTLTISHVPTAAELSALASNGSLNLQWTNATASVLTLSGDFRWTITYDSPSNVAEPGTLAGLGTGLMGLGIVGARRRKRQTP